MLINVKLVFASVPIVFCALLMLFASLPHSQVSAATGFTLSTYTGSPGDTVTISGTFDTVTSGLATIIFDGSYIGTSSISNGSFNDTFQVPVLPRGKYAVSVTVEGSASSYSTDFTITPDIYVNKNTVKVGAQITITGNGFSTGNVSIYIDNSTVPLVITTADSSGILNPITITVPAAINGMHHLKAVDIVGSTSTAFYIEPSLSLSTDICGAGSQITVTGTGFAGLSIITVNPSGIIVPAGSTIVTDKTGTFIADIIIPLSTLRGDFNITATDNSNNSSSLDITIRQSISLRDDSGLPGDIITVNGTSFDKNKALTIYFNDVPITSIQTDSYGAFSVDITIPFIAKGTYVVKATDNTNEATEDYSVESYIIVTPVAGNVGNTTSINGYGFAASSEIIILFDDENSGVTQTDPCGSFTITINVPAYANGEHEITAKDSQLNEASAYYNVSSSLSLNIDSGVYGDMIIINGNGFAADNGTGNIITLYIDNTVVMNIDDIYTDLTGSFTTGFNIPSMVNGNHIIKAVDTYDNAAQTTLTVNTFMQLDIETGVFGDTVQVTGYGFAAGKIISLSYNNVFIVITPSIITTDLKGCFTASFVVPNVAAGTYAVVANDGTKTASANFTETLETNPPPAVDLLSPIDESKISQPVTFNWSASSDPSGVHYRLQISTDANFNTIILDADNLSTTQYTMIDNLDSVSKKNPYHWRVIAVDGVGNESVSATDTFVVGFIWPLWLTYGILGLIGLIIFVALGLWVGRRMAALRNDKSYNYDMDIAIEDRYRDQYQDRDLRCDGTSGII